MNGIKRCRLRAGITQTSLAEQMDISQSTVAMWETGKSRPRIAALPILANVLQATVPELLDDTDNKYEDQEAAH